ncbi:MAG: T9SS type A sorting domain-containing protein, partial [Parafilimonas sp.]
VRLLQFTGVYENGFNELRWKAENEINFSHYDVERSTDGINFSKIATVAGAAASGVNNYSQNDNVKNISATIYYYRLKMVNKDGSSNYSSVINTKRAVEKTYTLLNNPFSDKIAVLFNLSQKEKITMVLYDAAGRLLRKQEFIAATGTNEFELNDLNGLPRGNYVLNIYTGNEKFSEKMVK